MGGVTPPLVSWAARHAAQAWGDAGRCLLWVNRVILTVGWPLPVYLGQRTSSEPVGMSQTCQEATSTWVGILIYRITPSREVPICSRAGHRIWPGRRYHRLDHGHARRPTRVLAWGQETDFYGSQLL